MPWVFLAWLHNMDGLVFSTLPLALYFSSCLRIHSVIWGGNKVPQKPTYVHVQVNIYTIIKKQNKKFRHLDVLPPHSLCAESTVTVTGLQDDAEAGAPSHSSLAAHTQRGRVNIKLVSHRPCKILWYSWEYQIREYQKLIIPHYNGQHTVFPNGQRCLVDWQCFSDCKKARIISDMTTTVR